MAVTFLTNVDLAGNQLLNFRAQVLASDPGSPASGQIWFNSVSERLKYFDGATTHTLASASGGTLTGLLGSAPIVATDNEDGTYTISISAASGSAAGSMSSTHWSKLEGIEAGAEVNPSASDILTALLSVDGSGSGLDADTVDGSHASDFLAASAAGANNGVAQLDSGGKLKSDQIPDVLLGGLAFQGAWDADQNAPTLASGTGTHGYYYIVSDAGTTTLDGISDWQVGDWAVFITDAWVKIDNTDLVVSVNSQTGAVVLDAGDIGYSGGTSGLAATDVQAALDEVVSDLAAAAVLRHSANVGNNSSTEIDITHNLGTRDVVVMVREAGSPYAQVLCDVEALSTTQVRLRFAVAPTTDQFRVTVLA